MLWVAGKVGDMNRSESATKMGQKTKYFPFQNDKVCRKEE